MYKPDNFGKKKTPIGFDINQNIGVESKELTNTDYFKGMVACAIYVAIMLSKFVF